MALGSMLLVTMLYTISGGRKKKKLVIVLLNIDFHLSHFDVRWLRYSVPLVLKEISSTVSSIML